MAIEFPPLCNPTRLHWHRFGFIRWIIFYLFQIADSMNKFIIFDNGGKTLDRFTIINKETGDVFGSSENPDDTNGAGKFYGNCADNRITMYGAGWRQKLPGKKVIKAEVDNYVNNAKLDPNWIGNEIDL